MALTDSGRPYQSSREVGHEGAQTSLVSAYDPRHEYLARARRDELLMIFAEIERLVVRASVGHVLDAPP